MFRFRRPRRSSLTFCLRRIAPTGMLASPLYHSLRARLICALHVYTCRFGNQAGRDLMRLKLRELAYFRGMSRMITLALESCAVHQTEGLPVSAPDPYSPILCDAPLDRLFFDFVQMWVDTRDPTKMKYILVVIDHFTKFVWAKAFATKEAAGVIDFLREIIRQHGCPKYAPYPIALFCVRILLCVSLVIFTLTTRKSSFLPRIQLAQKRESPSNTEDLITRSPKVW